MTIDRQGGVNPQNRIPMNPSKIQLGMKFSLSIFDIRMHCTMNRVTKAQGFDLSKLIKTLHDQMSQVADQL